jgi:hypothetical protein
MAAPTAPTVYTRQAGTNTATSTFNGTTTDARQAFSIRLFGSITNGATAPTIVAVANLQTSQDNFSSDINTVASAQGSLTNSGVTTYDFYRPFPGAYVRVQITGNTGQSVTYVISGNMITAVT